MPESVNMTLAYIKIYNLIRKLLGRPEPWKRVWILTVKRKIDYKTSSGIKGTPIIGTPCSLIMQIRHNTV